MMSGWTISKVKRILGEHMYTGIPLTVAIVKDINSKRK
jgi:hypothetical protein